MDEENSGHSHGLDTRLKAVEINVAVICSNYTTRADLAIVRADIARLEATMLKWFITTMIAITAVVFGVARYVN